MCSPVLKDSEIVLYDIDGERLKESEKIISAINRGKGNGARIQCFLGTENRRAALKDADFVVNAIQVGGYDPCTIIDFEVPKKYGLRQTIADTLGIGGIMRALRTIPVLEDFARDIEAVCPDAWFLNYTNPMAMLTGFLLRYTGVKTVGLCHSVQVCSEHLLKSLGMEDKLEGRREKIAGINHMAWLLEIYDRGGNDLYPEIKRRAREKNKHEKHNDMVRFDYIEKLGYYCTESSEHNAEYNPFYIKGAYPELIGQFNIPLDEYPRRCVNQIKGWKEEYESLSRADELAHERSGEYASYIMESISTGGAYKIGGNVLNRGGLISNLPVEACVEVPCLVDGNGVNPCYTGALPLQLAAMNMGNINVQLLTIEAARSRKREHIYHAAMMDPHTQAELPLDRIVKMVDELIEAHGNWLPEFR
jgi:alpha-galactosidase